METVHEEDEGPRRIRVKEQELAIDAEHRRPCVDPTVFSIRV